MKNNSVRKIVSCVALLVLCAATVAGLYLGIFGRTTEYATIHTEDGDVQQALNRQVAFIPNTINENWQEAIRPEAKLGGGYSYTVGFDGLNAAELKDAAKVLRARTEAITGNAATQVGDGAVTVTVPQDSYSATVAAVLSPVGEADFVLYNSTDGSMSDPVLDASHVKQTYYYSSGSTYQVQVQLNSKGVAAYNDLRAANSGSLLYLRLDGQSAGYTSLTALGSANTLTFTAGDANTAYIVVCCMRSGALPGTPVLENTQAAEPASGILNVLIILCAVVLALVAVVLLIKGRASGLVGVWTILAWVAAFFLFTALIAVSTGWVMTVISMIAIILCVCAFLCGLIALFNLMGAQIKRGRSAYAACADASRGQLKFQAILYGAVLAVGLLLMVIFRTGLYGILGRIVAVSALVSFMMVAVFPRLALGCWAALTGKK